MAEMRGHDRSRAGRRSLIEAAFAHGVRALQPDAAIRHVLTPGDGGFAVRGQEIAVKGRLIVVAVGKAAPAMAAEASRLLGKGVTAGYTLTKDGHLSDTPPGFSAFEAAHPVPDERGIKATRAILDGVEGLDETDVVLALISGGGSALFESPRDGVKLPDMQRVTELLLRAGAPIHHLNAVRSELSDIKGGGFRRAIEPARTVSLILSDVLGNAPEVIASGPTIARVPDPEQAEHLLRRYGVYEQVPDAVKAALRRMTDEHEADVDRAAGRDVFEIVGDNARLVEAVGDYIRGEGLSVDQIWAGREGEAREQAAKWIRDVQACDADVVLGGGEMTVTVRGDGSGGRNTEFALASVPYIAGTGEALTVASLASDGEDGNANAAGGIVDEQSAPELESAGYSVDAVLASSDSATALDAIGALVRTGPTGTNVNDVYIAARGD